MTPDIERKGVVIWEFLRRVLLLDRVPALPTNAISPHARASPFTTLHNSHCRNSEAIHKREFLRSDGEGIESIGAVRAVFEEVFFRLC